MTKTQNSKPYDFENRRYRAIVSSDWNECLAPCGPFDYIGFTYPALQPILKDIFHQYTSNRITLGRAVGLIGSLLPKPVTCSQMDAYLDHAFTTYTGVCELMEWCLSRNILFMVNTTGAVGYFQRVFAKDLLPLLPVISAHPEPFFAGMKTDPMCQYDLHETADKGMNTEKAVRTLGIPPDHIILIGDSGGDGPHFKWGAKRGAFLIGSMLKPSLRQYCERENIQLDYCFGASYSDGEPVDRKSEMKHNFMDLTAVLEGFLNRA